MNSRTVSGVEDLSQPSWCCWLSPPFPGDSRERWVAPGEKPAPGSPLPSLAGTSSSVLPHTWAACALPTLMLPQRSPSKVQLSDSGPARNGPLLVSPTCLSCVPTRSRQSRSHDDKAVAGGVGVSTCFSSRTGLHWLAKIATGRGVEALVWVCLFKILFLWALTGPLCLGRRDGKLRDSECVLLSIPSRHMGLLGYVPDGSGRVVLWETQGSFLLEKAACCRSHHLQAL